MGPITQLITKCFIIFAVLTLFGLTGYVVSHAEEGDVAKVVFYVA